MKEITFPRYVLKRLVKSSQDMPRKSEAKAAVTHRTETYTGPAPSSDEVGANKARTSVIAGHSRWEDSIVSHIRRSYFHSRSLAVTSSLSSGLFERIGLCPCPRTMTKE
jgi:hypothetical protein